MSAPTSSAFQRFQDRRRRSRQPPLPGTPAAVTGPQPSQEAAEQRGALVEQKPGALIGTGAEILASAAGGGVGGAVAGPLARRAGGRLVATAVDYLAGRIPGAAAGGVAASEAFAPAGEGPEEAAARRTQAAAEAAGGEALGGAVTAGVAGVRAGLKAGAALRRRLKGVPEPLPVGGAEPSPGLLPESESALELLSARGQMPTPGQFATGPIVNLAENIAEVSFLGRGFIQRRRGKAAAAALDMVQAATQKFVDVLTPQQLGQVVDDFVGHAAGVQKAMTRAAYKALDKKLGESGVNAALVNGASVASEMGALLRKYLVAGDPKATAILRTLRPFQRGPVNFEEAEGIRGMLLALQRKTADDMFPDVRNLAGRAAQLVDQQMQVSALRLGPAGQAVMDAFNLARSTARLGHRVFEDEILGQVIGKVSPEDLARALFKDDSPSRARALREVMFEPRFSAQDPNGSWNRIVDTWLGELKHSAGAKRDPVTGQLTKARLSELDGAKLGARLDDARGTFTELVPNAQARGDMRVAARALELTQKRALTDRSGSVMIQLMQAGAAGTVATGVISIGGYTPGLPEAGIILGGPGALGLVLGNRAFSRFMFRRAQAAVAKPGALPAIMAQAISHLSDIPGVSFTYRAPDGTETFVLPKEQRGPTSRAPGLKPRSKQ